MRKRVIYLLMTLTFILTTVSQAIGPVYAYDGMVSSDSHTSKILDFKKTVQNTSSLESILSSSNQAQQTVDDSSTKQSSASESQKEMQSATVQPVSGSITRAVNKIPANAIDDGITNWIPGGSGAPLGFVPFLKDPKQGLDYTFGASMVPQDPTEETTSGLKIGMTMYYTDIHKGQMNILLSKKEGSRSLTDLIGMLLGSVTGGIDTTAGPFTSMGYGFVFDEHDTGAWDSNTGKQIGRASILANKVTDKAFYVALMPNGSYAMKVMGHFNRVDPKDKTKTHQFLVEILMRPSQEGLPAVQQELYVKNETGQADNYGVLFSQDTSLGAGVFPNDNVPIKTIGANQGVYIEDPDSKSKLLAKMAVIDGPDDFGTPIGGENHVQNIFGAYTGNTFSGDAQKKLGQTVVPNKSLMAQGDTAYSAKWNYSTIKPNETKHYRQDVVGMIGPIVVPSAAKAWENTTSKDGLNRVGDSGKYTLTATNSGYQDEWENVKIVDTNIPSELRVDDQSIKLTVDDFNDQGVMTEYKADVPASAYHEASDGTKTITVEPGKFKTADGKAFPADLGDNDVAQVTFNVKIKSSASEKMIVNHVEASGTDKMNGTLNVKDSNDNEFKVEKDPNPTSMTKLVKNVTKGETAFTQKTIASAGDHVQYQIETTASPTNPLVGAQFEDILAPELKLTKTQVQYQNADDSWGTATDVTWDANSHLTLTNPVLTGKKVRLVLDVTIGSNVTDGQVITATAELIGGSYGIGTMPDEDADLTIVDKIGLADNSVHQYIKNLTQKDTDDKLTTTNGYKGDKIQYTFAAKSHADNTQKLLQVAIAHIASAPTGEMTYVDGSLKINGTAASAAIEQAFKAGNSKIDAVAELAKDTQLTVTYEMTIKNNVTQTITNNAWLTATKLDGSVPIDPAKPDDKGIAFNQTTLKTTEVNLTLTKKVGLVKSGATAATNFADSIEARPGDKVQYQIVITPDAKKELTDITVADVLDSDLSGTNNTAAVERQKADGTWGSPNPTAIDATGHIKIPNTTVAMYKGWKAIRITITATIKGTVNPATKGKIDNQASLTTGSYGVGTKSNKATITLIDRFDVRLDQTIRNITTGTFAGSTAFGSRGDTIEYYYSIGVPATNTTDMKNLIMKNIRMNHPEALQFIDGSLSVANGGGELQGTAAKEAGLKNSGQVPIEASSAPQTTYRVYYQMRIIGDIEQDITNDADIMADKLDGATDPDHAANSIKFPQTILTIQDKPKATIEQTVANTTHPTSDVNSTETAAKVGDKLHYTFKVTSPAKNKEILNAKIQNIIQTAPGLMGFDANSLKMGVVTLGNPPVVSTPAFSGFAPTTPESGLVQLGTPITPGVITTIDYDRTLTVHDISKSSVILNNGSLVADRLAATVPNDPNEDTEHNLIHANPTKVTIKTLQNVTVNTKIKNESEEGEDWQQPKTNGAKDNLIDYQFTIKANAANDADIEHMKIANIAMVKNDDNGQAIDASGDLTHQDATLKVLVDGVEDQGAAFSADHKSITLSKPLAKGKTAVVTYQMKVVTDKIDFDINNQAVLSADRLTDEFGDALKDPTTGVIKTETPFVDTVLHVKLGVSETTIRYVDVTDLASDINQQTWIAPTVKAIGKIKEPFSTGKYSAGTAEGTIGEVVGKNRVAPKIIDGYTVVAVSESTDLANNPSWEKAYKDDPLFVNKGRTITYGYQKRMLSVEAPSYWDFGNQNQSQTDTTYYLDDQKTPQKVKVTDNYGVDSWQLQVSQEKPFTDDRKQVLKDAELQFRNGTLTADANNSTPTQALSSVESFNLKPGETAKNLITYTKSGVFQNPDIDKDHSSKTNPYSDDQGKGTWTYSFGNQQNANISIGLHVPDTTKRDNTTYTTILDWSLTVAP